MYKLKDLRVSKHIPATRLADAIGVSETDYCYLEEHLYEMNFAQAKLIADALKVSMKDIDWFSGIEEASERRLALLK